MGTEHFKLTVKPNRNGTQTATLEINVFSLSQLSKKMEQLLNLETDEIELVEDSNPNGDKLIIRHWDAPWPEEFKTNKKITGEAARIARKIAYLEDDRGA